MFWLRLIYSRLYGLLRKNRIEQEMDDEMRFHLLMQTRQNIERGMRPDEAEREARRRFGNVGRIKDLARDIRGGGFMETLLQDLRYGVRQMLRSPSFTAVAVLSLALGIGANTALFSLIDAVLLKMLPVKKPEELALLNWTMGEGIYADYDGTILDGIGSSFSYPAFEQFRIRTQTLSDVFAFASLGGVNVNADGAAEIASAELVTGGFYSGLGVQMTVGRAITPDDDRADANLVVVISHRYWKRRFGLDPAALGKKITVNNAPATIIGVTPPQFYGGLQVDDFPDLSLPMTMEERIRGVGSGTGESKLTESWNWWVQMMGRMKPGVNPEQVRADLEVVFQQSALEGWRAVPLNRRPNDYGQPRDLPRLRVVAGERGVSYLRDAYRQPLRIMMIVVNLVLLIACANIANLLLARATTRRREIAVRLALGAGRFRLIRQLLTESVLLAVLGGALGWFLAWWTKDLLLMWHPWGGTRLDVDLQLDWRVFGFTASIALFTGILFGLAPALQSTRMDLTSALKDDSRIARGSLSTFGQSMVIAQVAVSFILLAGAGLFLRTLHNLRSVELGFDANNLLLFKVDPRAKGYKDEQRGPLYQRMIERIEAVPGVRSATISRVALLSEMGSSTVVFAQRGVSLPESERYVFFHNVGWNYFETMGIPLLAGRGLNSQDDDRAPKIAVINQTMAHKFFGVENPLGKRFSVEDPGEKGQFEIVGVVGDAKYTGQREQIPPTFYLSYLQSPLPQATFAVRTSDAPRRLIAAIREAVREVDRELPLFDIKTEDEQAEQLLTKERFFPKLTGFFGLAALLLAGIGLFGVMAYSAAQRTHEIAIRMALGATPGSIFKRVISQGMLLAIIGMIVGAAAASALAHFISSQTFELTRFISGFLFGVKPTDPLIFALVVLMLASAALLACYLPARRATKVDPMITLKCE